MPAAASRWNGGQCRWLVAMNKIDLPRREFLYAPQPDITLWELAYYMPALVAFITHGKDFGPLYDDLPEQCQRHFEVEAPPQ